MNLKDDRNYERLFKDAIGRSPTARDAAKLKIIIAEKMSGQEDGSPKEFNATIDDVLSAANDISNHLVSFEDVIKVYAVNVKKDEEFKQEQAEERKRKMQTALNYTGERIKSFGSWLKGAGSELGDFVLDNFGNIIGTGIVVTLIGLVGFVGYKGVQGLNRDSRVYKIESIIASKNYPQASQLLEEFTKQELLDEGRIAKCTALLRKSKTITELEVILDKDGVEKGTLFLEEVNKNGTGLSQVEIAELEEKINQYKEPVLFENILKAQKTELPELCKRYIKLYPKEKGFEIALQNYLLNELGAVSDLLKIDESKPASDFNVTYSKLMRLKADLEQYKSLVKLPIKDKEVLPQAEVDKYLSSFFASSNKDLKKGYEVKIIVLPSRNVKYSDSYVQERNKFLNPKLIGIVVDTNGSDVFVQFPESKKCDWATQWRGVCDYWKDDLNNIGMYEPKELQSVVSLNEFDKARFNEAVGQFNALVKSYTVENAKN